jgi:DNA polymerase III alpha subunit
MQTELEKKKEELLILCQKGLIEKNLYQNQTYRDRLKAEVREVSNQNEYDYFLDLVKNKTKYPSNQNNILIPFLLGIVDQFDIQTPSVFVQGEFPDIDTDYLPVVRDYLKNVWAPKEFGSEKVCNIGNYTTFAIKSSLIDMARVHGYDRNEILAITTKLGLKDDEGKVLTWEKALEQNKELAEYCNKYPDVAFAAARLVNRNRGRGKHAGGLVISSVPLSNFVPLVIDEDGNPVSAWVEGLHDQDLQPVGLIKYDLLVVSDLRRKAICCKMIKDRHGISSINALPGGSDWSDTTYLNDPKALAMANIADTKGIFQFESSGMRELVRKGGVSSFEDLVAYTALYRPGPLGSGMAERYIERKNYRESYEIHPLLQSVLKKTYGVMCYQEQVMQILNIVGKIPLKDCEIVRKAISKKKEKVFAKYKDMFINNGQIVLNWTKAEVENLWGQIVTFAEYGFNRSHAVAYTFLSSQLLWLKAHYPAEFFASTLQSETKDIKIKETKLDAERHNIRVESIDLNKSKEDFEIIDDKIYMGFSKIKGIGKEISELIVKNQPYKNFEDFLQKFGTDAKVIKPLVCLKIFGEDKSSQELFKFYEFYKKIVSSRKTRDTAQMKRRETIYEAITELCPEVDARLICEQYARGEDFVLVEKCQDSLKAIEKELKKYKKSVSGYEEKVAGDKIIDVNDCDYSKEISDESLSKLINLTKQEAEIQFYGFGWKHPMEKSPDYDDGKTFSQFEEDEDLIVTYVNLHVIEKPVAKESKKGKPYHIVKVEDADGAQGMLTIWGADYNRFKEEFEYWESDSLKGHFMKVKVKRPDAGFKSYTLDSPPPQLRYKYIPKEKEDDYRVILMARG